MAEAPRRPSRATQIAQSSSFPIGKVELPNLPGIAATTVLFPSTASLLPIDKGSLSLSGTGDAFEGFYYGGVGTPTTARFSKAIASLEGGAFSVLTPSGQSAIAATLGTLLKAGDHVLIVDTVTYTTRWYCDRFCAASSIDVTYYDPAIGGEIDRHLKPTTRVVFMESPGSMTFEVQDVPAICAAAANRGVISVLDNTWAASCFFEPFRYGVDISLLSLTKTHSAPAGVSLGAVVTRNEVLYANIKDHAAMMGLHVSSDDCVKASIALGTLHLRLRHQENSAQTLLPKLLGHPRVTRVMHPSLKDTPGYAFWRRDFSGANSLISVEFDGLGLEGLNALADAFRVIRIGYGWGGCVSLITIFEANEWRTVSRSAAHGPCMRIYLGLEDPEDLLEDIENSLSKCQRSPR